MSYHALIVTQKSDKKLSKLQKQFNTNILKINELKEQLRKDSQQLQTILSRVQAEIIPLENKHSNKLVELVYVFDKHYQDAFFKSTEREKLVDFILKKSSELIKQADKQELKIIFDKYAGKGAYDRQEQQSNQRASQMIQRMMKTMYGVEIDEKTTLSLNSPEEIQAILTEKLATQQAINETKKAEEPKSDKQLDKEKKRQEETKNISKAARSIYTELVKSFHPDREPDEDERIRKTEIMKIITQAYEKDDLFELLRLRIQLQDALTEVADEQLKYYNKMLKEQIAVLENSIIQLQNKAKSPVGGRDLFAQFGGNEKTMQIKFSKESNSLKAHLKSLEHDTKLLRIKENMRTFLKSYDLDDFYDESTHDYYA